MEQSLLPNKEKRMKRYPLDVMAFHQASQGPK